MRLQKIAIKKMQKRDKELGKHRITQVMYTKHHLRALSDTCFIDGCLDFKLKRNILHDIIIRIARITS